MYDKSSKRLSVNNLGINYPHYFFQLQILILHKNIFEPASQY